MLPGLTPVTLKEHEPDKRVHVAALRATPPVLDFEKVIVPAGENPPDTVAVQSEVERTAKDVGEQEIAVVVLACETVT